MGSCQQCITIFTNCLECNVGACFVCQTGYFVSSAGLCQVCPVTCLSCTSIECLTCVSTFSLVSGNCVCPIDYYVDSTANQCVSCTTIINCISCSSNICTVCIPTFFVSPFTKLCEACPTNCQQCDSTGCLICNTNYATVNNPAISPFTVC